MGYPLIVIYLALEIIGSVFEESELNFHFLVFSWLLDWLTFDKLDSYLRCCGGEYDSMRHFCRIL